MSVFTVESIYKMITGLLSPKNLSGPITIAKVAGASAEYGLSAWLNLLALLSISLAVLNLLPVPVLDGGHIVYGLIELVSGRPVTEKIQMVANQVGLAMVVCLMVFALYNDVLRL
jgi:regulator of sigma E protease